MARTVVSERLPERDNELAPGTKAYRVYAPILLTRLGTELARAHKIDGSIPLTAEGDIANASANNPIVVWAHVEDDLKDATVAKVIGSHDTTPMSEEKHWELIEYKAENGKSFTEAESQLILRRYVSELLK